MNTLFGVPMGTLLVLCVGLLAAIGGGVSVLALTNRVFFRLGVRKVWRRPARTLLVVFGLMLGTTIITAAFGTGDTMSNTVRSSALTGLGRIDEVISGHKGEVTMAGDQGATAAVPYIDAALFDQVRDAAAASRAIDGAMPAILEAVAVQDMASEQNEPRMTLSAMDPAYTTGFDTIRDRASGRVLTVADLAPDEVYLNKKAGENLRANAGDQVLSFASGRATPMRVKAIVDAPGAGSDGPAMLMSLPAAQAFLDKPGQVNYIVISNTGDATGGAARTDEAIADLQPVLDRLGLQIEPSKRDALNLADEAGSAFTSLFVTFGMFSIAAGLMLIFLIFVMLAGERKSEMGIARAVGTQRKHLVEMFLFEGMIYDVGAAAVGALAGVGVAYVMVLLLAQAFGTTDIHIVHSTRWRSIVVAYSLGVILTFVIVTLSAWRVSVLNIVSAIRDIPEAGRRKTSRAGWLTGPAVIIIGLVIMTLGLQAKTSASFNLGVSLAIIGLVPLLRRIGAGDRLAYSVSGFALAAWWLLPSSVTHAFLPQMSASFSIFVIAGLMAVVGGTWVLMYNSDGVLGGLTYALERLQLAPVMKTAISRSLANRFRTGMTVAMFAIVVLTLVVMSVVRGSIMASFNDYARFGEGFDVSGTTVQANPISDFPAALKGAEGVDMNDIQATSVESSTLQMARQVGASNDQFASYPVRGIDRVYAETSTQTFAHVASGYGSAREVWNAVEADPRLAVIDSFPVPRKTNFNVVVGGPKFKLEGIYMEDETFEPIDVEVQDPRTGNLARYTIIGILNDSTSPLSVGIYASQAGLEQAFGDSVTPNLYMFKLQPGADAGSFAARIETAFMANGMDAQSLRKQLHDAIATSRNFDYLFQGFAGLGLVVGVAALGVISARSVVERRQQIGVLRAIGFQQSAVQASFLIESSFVAVLGIMLGLVLGLVMSYNVVSDSAITGSMGHVPVQIPWLNLSIIFLTAFAVALLTTFLPARQASRIYPAAALRFE